MPCSALLAAAFLGLAYARHLPFDTRHAPRAIVAPISLLGAEGKDLSRRGTTAELPFSPKGYLSIDLLLGSNNQRVQVAFDTASSKTWVNPDCSKASSETTQKWCQDRGRFFPEQSNTYGKLTTQAGLTETSKTTYSDRFDIDLVWGKDTVTLAGKRMENSIFATAERTEGVLTGVLGAARPIDEQKPTLPLAMHRRGLIPSPLFSLHIDSNERGAVIFGGIDRKKFTGALQQLAVEKMAPDVRNGWWTVPVQSMSLSFDGKRVPISEKLLVAIDSAAPYSSFPKTIADAIAAAFASAIDPSSSDPQKKADQAVRELRSQKETSYVVDCAHQNLPGSFDLQFGEVIIQLPFSDLIRQKGKECVLNFRGRDEQPNSPLQDVTLKIYDRLHTDKQTGSIILGHTLLQHAYAVFQMKNDVVFIGKKSTCADSDIQDVPFSEIMNLPSITSTCT